MRLSQRQQEVSKTGTHSDATQRQTPTDAIQRWAHTQMPPIAGRTLRCHSKMGTHSDATQRRAHTQMMPLAMAQMQIIKWPHLQFLSPAYPQSAEVLRDGKGEQELHDELFENESEKTKKHKLQNCPPKWCVSKKLNPKLQTNIIPGPDFFLGTTQV